MPRKKQEPTPTEAKKSEPSRTITLTSQEYKRLQRIADMYGYGQSASAVAALVHELIAENT